MFPWESSENSSAQRNRQPVANERSAHAMALKQQVDQRAAAKAALKQQQLKADQEDDARVVREAEAYKAEFENELQAQRDREALVARREAMAAQRYQAEQSREQKVAQYQQRLEASVDVRNPAVAGSRVPVRNEKVGISEHPSTRVHAAPGGHSSLSLAHTDMPAARAPAPAPAPTPAPSAHTTDQRPDQAADDAAKAIRARARGGALW